MAQPALHINIDEINKKISNPAKNLASLKGLEIIAENLVYKIYDLFGRNALLSMLYQIGKGTALTITKRIKEKYGKDVFQIEEALQILMEELKDLTFYKLGNNGVSIK